MGADVTMISEPMSENMSDEDVYQYVRWLQDRLDELADCIWGFLKMRDPYPYDSRNHHIKVLEAPTLPHLAAHVFFNVETVGAQHFAPSQTAPRRDAVDSICKPGLVTTTKL